MTMAIATSFSLTWLLRKAAQWSGQGDPELTMPNSNSFGISSLYSALGPMTWVNLGPISKLYLGLMP